MHACSWSRTCRGHMFANTSSVPAARPTSAPVCLLLCAFQDPQWDALDPWVGPPVVLVVGERDAKFVDINTRVLARLTRSGRHGARPGHHGQQGQGQDGGHGVAGAAMRGSYSAAVAAAGAQLRRHGHAMLRVAGAGHAVHVECPEVLLGVLQEVAAAL